MEALPHCEVTCPTCFETFSIPGPSPADLPAEWDYDCEVCCRPMVIRFDEADGQIVAEADSI
ncbi:MAG: CPXCG motif-containing cysteine-rich protein [Puniceicoccales bacterium]